MLEFLSERDLCGFAAIRAERLRLSVSRSMLEAAPPIYARRFDQDPPRSAHLPKAGAANIAHWKSDSPPLVPPVRREQDSGEYSSLSRLTHFRSLSASDLDDGPKVNTCTREDQLPAL